MSLYLEGQSQQKKNKVLWKRSNEWMKSLSIDTILSMRERSEVLCSALQRGFGERERETHTHRQRVTPELLPCGGAMATLHLFAIFSALTTTLLLCIPTSSCSCLNTGLYRKSSNLLLLLLLVVVLLSPIASNCLEQNASIIRTIICKLAGLIVVK
jgi:hypothetical protein